MSELTHNTLRLNPSPVPLPDSLRIGPFEIQVMPWNPMSAASSRRYGEFSSMEQVIRVDPNAGKIKTCDTLLHEVLHAIYWVYTIDEKDGEERTVAMLSTALLQVFMDNPDLREFINESLKP